MSRRYEIFRVVHQETSATGTIRDPSKRLHPPLIRISAICVAIAMVVAACGSSSGDDAAATTTLAVDEGTSGAVADEGGGVYFVRVQYQVDEATADATLSVLSANGFDEFTKEASGGNGFDVVARGLTEDGAAALVVRLTTNTDVPYAGVVFEEG
jgi:hypothetical protein